MDQLSAHLIATIRREEYLREAANERLVRRARRERCDDRRTEPGPARRHREAPRPAIA
ncbi:MAG TPA: hypothetical protein VGX25_31040 [Actinophytocola sp.]|uniref:hypothetical protein n=1 Tax=Actinophytocola sp. TaxID=1872138 RepID=UPI002DDD14E4|nr:hypothetical protein [Actinophytocola sp.]HEV2783844.1 hypothetical protein [Actinophytocola sp.]